MQKGRLRSRNGYVLLTVLCAFAFLSVLGFTLLTASLANMQSAQRKLSSAQADSYAVSLAESVNSMVVSGAFSPLISTWKQEFLSHPLPDGQDSAFFPQGESHDLSTVLSIPNANEDEVRFSGTFYFTDVTVQKGPEQLTCTGTLEADIQMICVQNNREVAFQFHSIYDAILSEDGTETWALRRFERKRDYEAP